MNWELYDLEKDMKNYFNYKVTKSGYVKKLYHKLSLTLVAEVLNLTHPVTISNGGSSMG